MHISQQTISCKTVFLPALYPETHCPKNLVPFFFFPFEYCFQSSNCVVENITIQYLWSDRTMKKWSSKCSKQARTFRMACSSGLVLFVTHLSSTGRLSCYLSIFEMTWSICTVFKLLGSTERQQWWQLIIAGTDEVRRLESFVMWWGPCSGFHGNMLAEC